MDEEEEVVTVNVWRRRLKTMTFDDGGTADQDNVRMKTLKMTARREMAATTTSLPLLLFCEGEINAFTATRARLRETRCALKSAGVPCLSHSSAWKNGWKFSECNSRCVWRNSTGSRRLRETRELLKTTQLNAGDFDNYI